MLKALIKSRAFKKAISWRFIALTTTIVIVYFSTGSLVLAGSVGILDTIFKTAFYWFHEKAWEAIPLPEPKQD